MLIFSNIDRRIKHSGASLIELMIAITLGLLIISGMITVFIKSSNARNEVEQANQQIENGRYAMQLLTDDIRNAGYLAELNPYVLPTPTAKPDPCAFDLSSLNAALPISVQGYDNAASAPSCLSDIKSNTDILVVRRVSTCAVGDPGCDAVVASAPYLQASACGNSAELASTAANGADNYRLDTNTANLNRHTKNCTSLAPLHQYRTHIYFIANNDKAGDGVPTLKRAELGVGGFTIVPLVEGIEDLQIEYGLDNPALTTGSPTAFTANPDAYNSCSSTTTPTCAAYWRNTVAAKVFLLARNLTSTTGYSTTKTYSMGIQADGITANVDGPFTDQYKRHAFSAVARLNNVAGRNTP